MSKAVRDTVVIDRCSKQLDSLPENQQRGVINYLMNKYGVNKPAVEGL